MVKDTVHGVDVAYFKVTIGTPIQRLLDQHTVRMVSTLKSDSTNVGIIYLGNYEDQKPTYEMLKSEKEITRGDLYNMWVYASQADQILHIRTEKDVLRLIYAGIKLGE